MDAALGLELHKDNGTSHRLEDRHSPREPGVQGDLEVAKSLSAEW